MEAAREAATTSHLATTTAVAQDHPILHLTTTREETTVVHLHQGMEALLDMVAAIIMAELETTQDSHTMAASKDREATPATTTVTEEMVATRAGLQAGMRDQEMTGPTAAQWASTTSQR
jgi:hypothetical protein